MSDDKHDKRPKLKEVCHKCGYYDKSKTAFYKCYVPGECPARHKVVKIERGHASPPTDGELRVRKEWTALNKELMSETELAKALWLLHDVLVTPKMARARATEFNEHGKPTNFKWQREKRGINCLAFICCDSCTDQLPKVLLTFFTKVLDTFKGGNKMPIIFTKKEGANYKSIVLSYDYVSVTAKHGEETFSHAVVIQAALVGNIT